MSTHLTTHLLAATRVAVEASGMTGSAVQPCSLFTTFHHTSSEPSSEARKKTDKKAGFHTRICNPMALFRVKIFRIMSELNFQVSQDTLGMHYTIHKLAQTWLFEKNWRSYFLKLVRKGNWSASPILHFTERLWRLESRNSPVQKPPSNGKLTFLHFYTCWSMHFETCFQSLCSAKQYVAAVILALS